MKYILPLCILLGACTPQEEQYSAGYEVGCEFGTDFSTEQGYKDGTSCFSEPITMRCQAMSEDPDYVQGIEDGCMECGDAAYSTALTEGRADSQCRD